MKRFLSALALSLLCLTSLTAQDNVPADSLSSTDEMGEKVPRKRLWERGLAGKVVRYFNKANQPKPLDEFDFSVIGGPFYDKTSGLGIGICGSGLYHLQPSNPSLPHSDISLTVRATTKGMFSLDAEGRNYLPNDRFRADYEVELTTFRNEFWGLGYAQNDVDAHSSFFTRNQVFATGSFLVRLAPRLYLGPSLYYSLYYADKRDARADSLLGDRPRHTSTPGLGLTLRYDSRDHALEPRHGMYFNLEQRIQPSCLGNKRTFTTTEMEWRAFTPLWKGCILGGEIHALVNCGKDIPWTEYAYVGGNQRMRGYYEARYMDRNVVEAQVELRQHIKGRSGVVAWAGFANVFRDTHSWQFRQTLPNGGFGYRWRFKPGVNVRLDLGFTRNGPSFIFAINEAF